MTGPFHCRISLWLPQFMGMSCHCNSELTTCNNLDPNGWLVSERAVQKWFWKQID